MARTETHAIPARRRVAMTSCSTGLLSRAHLRWWAHLHLGQARPSGARAYRGHSDIVPLRRRLRYRRIIGKYDGR